MGGLSGVRILLLRPGSENDDFVRLAQDSGARVFHHPVMSIQPVNSQQTTTILSSLADYQRVIFVSRVAAGYFFALLQSLSLVWPPGLRAYAVGKTTAGVIASEGVAVETPGALMTSEGLLALPSLQRVAGTKLLLVCGEGGRDLLAETLQRRGAEVTRCELYRRQLEAAEKPAILELINQRQIDLIVAHSGELIGNLQSLVAGDCGRKLAQLPLVVPSSRLVSVAQQAGFQTIIESGSAVAEAMVSAIAEWYSKQLN